MPTTVEPWDVKGPRRASVNSFGYGGFNAHAVLEGARDYLLSRSLNGYHRINKSLRSDAPQPSTNSPENAPAYSSANDITNDYLANGSTDGMMNVHSKISSKGDASQTAYEGAGEEREHTRLFVIPSFDEAAGENQAKDLITYLEERIERADGHFMDDLAYTPNERRTNFMWKAAVSAQSAGELIKRLGCEIRFSKTNNKQTIGFIFTGQGAQWCGMGCEILELYPIFRNTIEGIGVKLKSIGAPFDLTGNPPSS